MPDITGWPTDAGAGSVSTEARWRSMARLWAPDGVVYPYLGHMVPSYAGGNVTVQAGGAWVDGHYCEQLSSSSVAVSTNGLVVVRFTPADNRFQIVWVNGAVSPTQTAGTWELPIARMTGGAMTDVRAFANHEYVHTTMIADEAVDTGKIADGAVVNSKLDTNAVTAGKIADEAVTSIKLSPGSVAAFIEFGGQQTDVDVPLGGAFQTAVSQTFTKPASWGPYEISVWGAAALRSSVDEICEVRVSVGANNGAARSFEIGGGRDVEVGNRSKWAGLSGSTQIVSVDVRRTSSGSVTSGSAWVQYVAMRTG